MVTCKDSWPQFGKDDVDVIRFASLRFDHALDENDRSAVTRALASRATSIASWRTVAQRTYAIARFTGPLDVAAATGTRATCDEPPVLAFRIRPVFAPRLPELARVLGGPGRPQAVLDAHLTDEDVVVELQPSGKAIALVLALVDATLAATPGRTIEPLLPISDDVLANYASLRLRDAEIDASRVLEPYVEQLLDTPASDS